MSTPLTPINSSSSHPTALESTTLESEIMPEEQIIKLIGDEQYFDDPDLLGFYRSLSVLGIGPPGLRLPGMTYGIPFVHENFGRTGIPDEWQELYQGMISTGDIADVCSDEEIRMFIDTLDRIQKADPLERQMLLLFIIGNHDVFHAGTANSGTNFLFLLGLVLNLQWGRNYRRDIHGAEVGGETNILDKEKLVRFIFEEIFKMPLHETLLETSYIPLPSEEKETSSSPLGGRIPSPYYRLQGESEKRWSDSNQVYDDFWKENQDGSFSALVHYKPNSNRRPEKKWLYTSAVKMADVQTANGKHPVFFINLDTMDYLKAGTDFGGVQGHVSNIQVQLIKAFMEKMRQNHPGSSPKFMIGGHFPADNISGVAASGLNDLLSNPDVIAYIAGHTHNRGFEDLNGQKGISRKEPLPMIVVPSVMDYPNEMVILKYGATNPELNRLSFEFTFTGIQPEKVEGLNDDVKEELRLIWPRLNSFEQTLNRIKDPQIREFVDPKTKFGRQIYLALNLDEGLFSRRGALHDLVIAEDVIPTMVQGNLLYKRLFLSSLKLELLQAGFRQEAADFEKAYLQQLEHLNDFYDKIYREDFATGKERHIDIDHLDAYSKPLDSVVDRLKDISEGNIEGSHPLTPKNREILQTMAHVAELMQGDINYYKDWLIQYELVMRTKRSDEELKTAANLFGNTYFDAINHHLRDAPYGSSVSAFATIVGLKSARLYQEFRSDPITDRAAGEGKIVPDRIRVEVSTPSGEISIRTIDLPYSPETNFDALEKELGIGATIKKEPIPIAPSRKVEGHWSFNAGGYLGQGTTTFSPDTDSASQTQGSNNGFSLALGGEWHLVNSQKAPRINLQASGGVNLDFQNRPTLFSIGTFDQETTNFEFPARVALTIGDPYGLIEAGPVGMIGPALRGYDETPFDDQSGTPVWALMYGVGGYVAIGEGFLSLETGKKWSLNPEVMNNESSYWMLQTNLFTLGRAFGILPRNF